VSEADPALAISLAELDSQIQGHAADAVHSIQLVTIRKLPVVFDDGNNRGNLQ
jgi:glutaredoxin